MSTPPGTAPQLRPLGVGEILDVCINIFTKNFLTFLRIVLVLVVPVQIVTVLIQVSTVSDPDLLPTLGSTGGGKVSSDEADAYLGGQIVIIVLGVILSAVATAACFKAVGDAYLGSRPDWRTSLSFAARRFHSVLWVTFLVTVTATLGLILLIVPGVWLWFSFAVAVPVLLFEGLKGTAAMSRSRQLVKGRWWATAGAILAAYIIAAIVGGIFQGLISALVLTDAGNSVLGTATVNALASGIGQLVTTPFSAAVAAVVYYDLRVRKEGFDLQLLAERLGVTPPAGPAPGAMPAGSSVPVWERQPPPPPPPPPPAG
jgi:Membrane domain of glycerophosphoryl diester phosphodiesterase